jgi:hypothetical protein
MVISYVGSLLQSVIYLLCVITSLLCAHLLMRAYYRSRTRLLIWSALCFCFLALNNLLTAADILILPTIDLTGLRLITALLALALLLYGFIWEV